MAERQRAAGGLVAALAEPDGDGVGKDMSAAGEARLVEAYDASKAFRSGWDNGRSMDGSDVTHGGMKYTQ